MQTGSLTTGFKNAQFSQSSGKKATCVSGLVPVRISAVNTKLLFPPPTSQYNVTEFIQELTQVGSTTLQTTNGGPNPITGTYNISATLCWPTDNATAAKVQTLQVLVHGVGLDKSYWDISPGYSYVDAAASAGYATLTYDRLGVGLSDHPDPIQVVQSYADVEIQHGLVNLVRTSQLGQCVFKNVVGVGHSYGSVVTVGETSKYPTDLDAVILTGVSSTLQYLASTILSNDPAVAALNDPAKWGALPYAYLVHETAISIQQPFFRYPDFDINSTYSCSLVKYI